MKTERQWVSPPEWGPAMAALNAQQRAFVMALFMPPYNGKAAYQKAYPAANENSAGVGASRLLSLPQVQLAVQEYTYAELAADGPEAIQILREMRRGGPTKERLKAVMAVINRIVPPRQVVEHTIDPKLSIIQKWQRLVELMRTRGESEEEIQATLANLPDDERQRIIEGEYVDITPALPSPGKPFDPLAGLEDIP